MDMPFYNHAHRWDDRILSAQTLCLPMLFPQSISSYAVATTSFVYWNKKNDLTFLLDIAASLWFVKTHLCVRDARKLVLLLLALVAFASSWTRGVAQRRQVHQHTAFRLLLLLALLPQRT